MTTVTVLAIVQQSGEMDGYQDGFLIGLELLPVILAVAAIGWIKKVIGGKMAHD